MLLRRALAIAALGTSAVVGLRVGASLEGALGTDAALWGLTARDLLVGAPPLVPPLYPATFAPMVALGGSPVTWGGVVSALSIGALTGLAFLLARQLGASARASAVVALSTLVLPDTLGWAVQLQPDALAAAWGMALALALAGLHTGRAGLVPLLAVVLLGGLASVLREHGLVWAGVAMVGLLARPGPSRRAALAVPLVMWLSPLLFGIAPGMHPLDVPWADRAGGALAAFTTRDPSTLAFLHELHRADRQAYAALVTAGDRFGQLAWHVTRSLRLAPDGWLVWGAALGSAVYAALQTRRGALLAAALPLLAAAPALLIWSQRRHVLLVVPLALVVLAAAWSARPRLCLLGLGVLGVHGAVNWPGYVAAWQTEVPRARHYAEVGAWLHAHSTPGDLLGGVHQDVGLYAPALPRHDPDGTPADWRTFLVSDRPPPPRELGTWQVVFQGPALRVYQLDPQRSPRPCAEAPPPTGAPHLAVAQAQVVLTGCTEPPLP